MEVILLERLGRLGQIGDTVRVKDGFARNYLLPRHKALRANKANKERFERERAQIEARNLELKTEAGVIAEKLDGQSFIVVRQAGELGQLYGSVSSRPRCPDQDDRTAQGNDLASSRSFDQGDSQRRPIGG
jgi:large subunit ribosomal protein L9